MPAFTQITMPVLKAINSELLARTVGQQHAECLRFGYGMQGRSIIISVVEISLDPDIDNRHLFSTQINVNCTLEGIARQVGVHASICPKQCRFQSTRIHNGSHETNMDVNMSVETPTTLGLTQGYSSEYPPILAVVFKKNSSCDCHLDDHHFKLPAGGIDITDIYKKTEAVTLHYKIKAVKLILEELEEKEAALKVKATETAWRGLDEYQPRDLPAIKHDADLDADEYDADFMESPEPGKDDPTSATQNTMADLNNMVFSMAGNKTTENMDDEDDDVM